MGGMQAVQKLLPGESFIHSHIHDIVCLLFRSTYDNNFKDCVTSILRSQIQVQNEGPCSELRKGSLPQSGT